MAKLIHLLSILYRLSSDKKFTVKQISDTCHNGGKSLYSAITNLKKQSHLEQVIDIEKHAASLEIANEELDKI